MTEYIEKPKHEAIQDCRGYLKGQRVLSLVTYQNTLRTSLLVVDLLQEGNGTQLLFELDRKGRDQLIAELIRANNYEDLRKANPQLLEAWAKK